MLSNTKWIARYKKSGTSAMCPYRILVGMARRAVRRFYLFRYGIGIREACGFLDEAISEWQ